LLFDFSNYIFFLIALAIVYIAAVNLLQSRIGGKGRMPALQKQMRDVQLRMIEASKRKDEKAINEANSEYMKLTGEFFTLQMQMTAVILVIFLGLAAVFPYLEPGAEDDVAIPLHDDGLAEHCDESAGDYIFSGCLALPPSAPRGAWVVDVYLNSSANELLSRNATAVYYEGGSPKDVWLQSSAQSGWTDILMGKSAYYLNATTDKGENKTYKSGETAAIRAIPHNTVAFTSPQDFARELEAYNSANQNKLTINYSQLSEISREAGLANGTTIKNGDGTSLAVRKGEDGAFLVSVRNLPNGAHLGAASNSGTVFHYDAPITIPLINIRRITGSYGVFIFLAFVISISYTLVKAAYSKVKK
jgi:hypothetical protein